MHNNNNGLIGQAFGPAFAVPPPTPHYWAPWQVNGVKTGHEPTPSRILHECAVDKELALLGFVCVWLPFVRSSSAPFCCSAGNPALVVAGKSHNSAFCGVVDAAGAALAPPTWQVGIRGVWVGAACIAVRNEPPNRLYIIHDWQWRLQGRQESFRCRATRVVHGEAYDCAVGNVTTTAETLLLRARAPAQLRPVHAQHRVSRDEHGRSNEREAAARRRTPQDRLGRCRHARVRLGTVRCPAGAPARLGRHGLARCQIR